MASNYNRYLGKALKFADNLAGHSARKMKHQADVLNEAKASGMTAERASRLAEHARMQSLKTRVTAGAGVAGAGIVAGVSNSLYNKHKENVLQEQIASYYS